ncbi:stage V sporulation protein B [Sporomusaceae bacterium BoRhaA]|uniref:putative polysaccharide biosynthesis protein n=1 Tax=Pelorhabdus rhamnosifermentans TaxID=2772457 RepID=UPI001C060F8E|nr:polysaccharide biosynthesis protein [Pelorhabdus rhamnosifermentans]MBU2700690.1 stage V sporulation protein B [Pelorhabdus rhamnosifermentans]
MSRDSFLKGALVLTAAGVVVKMIGAVNRIVLSRLLGGEGIGLYQLAYPIYLLALSVSSAGLPVAISILVAEKVALSDTRGARRIFHISFVVLTITGLFFSILLYYGAGWLIESQFVRDERAYYALVALAPAIFCVTVMSSYRGYFQGQQTMIPTALSQIIEQIVRVFVMIGLAYYLLSYGIEFAAAGASFGAAPGAACGLLLLIIYERRQRQRNPDRFQRQRKVKESWFFIVSRMVRLAFPVSLANVMVPVVASIDLMIVPARLEIAGYTVQQATELFGYLTGMAVALINVPAILTGALAASLVPAVAQGFTLNRQEEVRQKLSTALTLANAITVPAMCGLYLLATPISLMLYGTPNAGAAVSTLSLGIVFLGIHQVSTGVLQGLGHTTVPVVNMFFAAIIKIVLSYFLTALPHFGIQGAALATVADFAVGALLNMLFIYRVLGCCFSVDKCLATCAAAAVMGLTVLKTYDIVMIRVFSNTIATLASVASAILIYGITLVLMGGIGLVDMERLPRVGPLLVKGFRWVLRR